MGPGAFCPPTEHPMHDDAACQDRAPFDVSTIEEGISALVDSRTRPIPSPALRRPSSTIDRALTAPGPEDHTAMEEQSPEASAPPTRTPLLVERQTTHGN